MTAWEKIRWNWRLARRVALDGAVLDGVSAQTTAARGAPVCIVRLDGIGDFILWLDACRRLVAHYRSEGSRVVLAANVIWAPWARELGLADEVWEFDRARFAQDAAYRKAWLLRMRGAGFGTVVQPAHSRRAVESDALVRASGAPRRIGSAGDATNSPAWLQRRADRWYTQLIDCGDAKRMELLRNADFMRGLGFADFRARAPRLEAPLPPNRAGLARRGYAVLIPAAGSEMRAWPVASFADTGRRLAAQGLALVLAGGAIDSAIGQALLRELPQARDLTGRTTLAELAALASEARVVVTNETGAAHIAAAVGTPVVCVMGGGHYGRFLPYALEETDARPPLHAVAQQMACFGCNWHCIYARAPGEPVKCVRDIAPDKVWAEVAACLAANPA